ncbi:glycosyltransferase STELLO2 [Biomphalaria glabrata]|nr:glycosyltransferase STELLO2 [Biomphalaria glabrata]
MYEPENKKLQKVTIRRLFAGLLAVCLISILYFKVLTGYHTAMRFAETDKLSAIKIKSADVSPFEKWIVVTSIHPPTDDVKYLAQLPGWRVVVVGDVKSPANWSFLNCDFLSIEKQQLLNFKITDSLPYKSYARKNIGYLYAILNGAKYIYETDDDNRPSDNLDGFIYTPETSGLMYAGKKLFNPYQHFGQSTLWPRGYPLSKIGAANSRSYWLSNSWTSPTIQQGTVNGDPDVDAIFRLTRKSVTSPLNVTFDFHAPPVLVPQGVFSPFNSQNTLFHKRAFWALLIPTGTTFRMCDIWRGYWAQRLMWEIGDRLAFFPPNAHQNRSAHSYMEDAEDEKDMYFQTDTLIDFLTNWTCPSSMTFFQCVLKLTSDMADKHFWISEEIELTSRWLEDLLDLGYPEPKRVRNILSDYETLKLDNVNIGNDNNYKNPTPFTKITFIPVEQKSPQVAASNEEDSIPQKAFKSLSKICPNITTMVSGLNSTLSSNYYYDILLVIVFNWPGFYSNVRYLDALYGQVFPNIIYCGDNASLFAEQTQHLGKQFSFIDEPLDSGTVNYMCAVRAIEMNFYVKGFLIMGDDVLFKHWAFLNSSKDHFWTTFEGRYISINISQSNHRWFWWNSEKGKEAFDKTLEDLKSNLSIPQFINSTSLFLDSLWTFTGSSDLIEAAICDVYYIPASKRLQTSWFMKKFHQNRVFSEIVVPTVVRGLETKKDLVRMNGSSLWKGRREKPFRFYSKVQHFLHPMKLTDPVTFLDMCTMYVPDILRCRAGSNKWTRQKNGSSQSNTGRHQSTPQFNRTKEIKPLIRDIDSVSRRWRGQQSWPSRINTIPTANREGSRHRFLASSSFSNYTSPPLTASGILKLINSSRMAFVQPPNTPTPCIQRGRQRD